jgi:TonB family protein
MDATMATKSPLQAVKVRVRAESYDELAILAQRAQALTNASGTAIALSEGNAAEIICRARAGSVAPEVGTALLFEGTFTGLCIQSGKELRCDDAETDNRVDKEATRELGIRSMVAVPIKEEGRVVGVLAAFAPAPHAFSITHVVVLKTMADQIAAYLHRTLGDEARSPQPLPAPPMKAAAASAAAPPALPPPVVTKPAKPASKQRQLPVLPKVDATRATKFAEEIDRAPSSQKKATHSRDEQKESKIGFLRAFGTFFRRASGTRDAAAAPGNRPGASVLILGAAAVVVIAVAVGLSFKLRRPPAAPQPEPALEMSSSPGTPVIPSTPATPISASVKVQPEKNTPPALPENDEPQLYRSEVRPKREATVVLPVGPSKISEARDNPAPTFDAPAISLSNVPASGSLSDLVSPASQPPNPRLLTQSEFEPVTAITKVQPVYPLVAKEHKLTGNVVVQGIVNKNGKISNLQQIGGSPLFRDAAFAAVRQWVFKPAKLNGQAIDQLTTIHLHFGVQ